MHGRLCCPRDPKCMCTSSLLMYRACVTQTQARTRPIACNHCDSQMHTLTNTDARSKHMQTHRQMIPTPHAGVTDRSQNHCSANTGDNDSHLQAQSTQVDKTRKMHSALSTITNPKPAVFSLSQNEGNPFGVTGRTINSLDGRGFETTISHFRQRTENCDKFFDFRIRDTDHAPHKQKKSYA